MNICQQIENELKLRLPEILALRRRKQMKPDNSYVTEGDLLCQSIVLGLTKGHPDKFEVISEEMENGDFVYDKGKNYLVVDPIDGTENFTSGLMEWGISVSVYKNGQHDCSMIGLPELGLWLHSGDKVAQFESRLYGLSSSLVKEDLLVLPANYEYRMSGCCAYNMYNVITGRFKVFENPRGVNSWDILAGLNLALEHDKKVVVEEKEYKGEFLVPTQKYKFKIY